LVFDPQRSRDRVERAVLLAIVLVAIWLRFWPDGSVVAGRTFERNDEVHYVDLARQFLNGNFNTRYFINPTLYGYVLAAVTAGIGVLRSWIGLDPSFAHFVARETLCPFVLLVTGRLLSITASILSVLVIARIGRRLFTPSMGLVAAWLLALDDLALQRAVLCGNESLMLLLALLAVERATLAPGESASRARRFAAGMLLGLATATKYSAGILIVPLFLSFGRGVVPALLGSAAGFALGSPMALINYSAFIHGFSTQASFLHEGLRERDVFVSRRGFVFYLKSFPDAHHGLALALACAGGILGSISLVVARRDKRHLFLLGASLPLYLFLGTGIFKMARFLLPAVPFILLHGAWLIERFVRSLATRLHARPWIGLAASLALVVALSARNLATNHVGRHEQFGHPEPMSVLFAGIRHALRPDERVLETAITQIDRLLLEDDPWSRLKVERPPQALQEAVLAELRARELLPVSRRLRTLILSNSTFADFESAVRADGAEALVTVVATKYLRGAIGPQRGEVEGGLVACRYWNELIAWLHSLPRRAAFTSPDGRTSAAVLELGGSAR
jgi:hypothetical protein